MTYRDFGIVTCSVLSFGAAASRSAMGAMSPLRRARAEFAADVSADTGGACPLLSASALRLATVVLPRHLCIRHDRGVETRVGVSALVVRDVAVDRADDIHPCEVRSVSCVMLRASALPQHLRQP
eukprot:6183510-Pleurochrysis_carterae.AAC.1